MGDNRLVMAAARTYKPDTVGVRAVDLAREALLELADAGDVGEHLGYASEDERVTTHYFACTRAGYVGWRWSVIRGVERRPCGPAPRTSASRS